MAPPPAYTDLGKAVREVLSGGKWGTFQYDQKLTASTKTADGVGLTFAAVRKGDKAELSLKSDYIYKNYSLSAVFNTSDKVALSVAANDIAPGVKATLSAILPDASSGRLTLDYANSHVNLRANSSLTSSPRVGLMGTTIWKGLLLGGEVGYDTAKSAVSSYGAAVSYTALDSQFALALTDKLETLQLLVYHAVNKSLSLGADITRPVAGGDVAFHLGAQKRLDNGATLLGKLDNRGILSVLYGQTLPTGERFGISTQIDTLDPSGKPPKIGFQIDLA